MRLLLAAASLALFACAAYAQTASRATPPPLFSGQNNRPRDIGSPEEEIIRRAEIKHEEESHKEMVERADETALIGEQILNSFQKNKSLDKEDLKKLDRMEKLARKIRGNAGGSDDEVPLDNPPQQLEKALARLAEISEKLHKSVQKTSRLVISVEFVVPAPISKRMAEKIRRNAVRAFKAIDGAGFARVDFFLRRDNGKLLLNELNTIPGLTDVSGFPKMWDASGVPFPRVLDRLVELAFERHAEKSRNLTSI